MASEAAPSRSRWWRVLFVAALFALIWWQADVVSIAAALQRIGVVAFLVCVPLEWLFFAIESLRIWHLGAQRYPLAIIWRSRLLSALVGTVLPGLAAAEVVRVFLLDRARPGRKLHVALMLLANRLYGMVSLASLWLLISVFMPEQTPPAYQAMRGWIVVACLLVVVSPLLFSVRFVRGVSIATLRALPPRLERIGRRVHLAVTEFSDVRRWAVALLTSTVTNLIVVFEFSLLSWAAGADINFAQWTVFVPLVAVATFLPLGLGAVGTQDAAMIGVAKLSGLPIEPVIAVSVAVHLLRYVGPLPGLLYTGDLESLPRVLMRQPRNTSG